MTSLLEMTSYADAQQHFSTDALWSIFSGGKGDFNITHECVDRHAVGGRDRVAISIAHASGRDELITFGELSAASSQFAHYLIERGVKYADRVAVMLDPSLAYYAALFGAMKMGAIAVPLFTAFGPDGIRLRLDDCRPVLVLTNQEKASLIRATSGQSIIAIDDELDSQLRSLSSVYRVATSPDDLAVYQYTSGTTRELPEAVRHTHKALVTVMAAALYGTGIRPGDRFFCPSSPAWGHGLWHGTLAPLGMGVSTGTFSGKFDAVRWAKALSDYGITNLSAAATHYRLLKNSGAANQFSYCVNKATYTGEPVDSDTLTFAENTFQTDLCSMYGTTEMGVLLVNYPGASDFKVKPGSLGRPIPGIRVDVQSPSGSSCKPGETGEIKIWRSEGWISTKDLGRVDEDGYFYHGGRADDVIISAGWTISPVEIEDTLLRHPDILEVAVVGVPDETRGQAIKAFIVTKRRADDAFTSEVQQFVRSQLSNHEFPRYVEVVSELPKTPAGKVNRKKLRNLKSQVAAAI
jgi:acetyl-CoA synthetase